MKKKLISAKIKKNLLHYLRINLTQNNCIITLSQYGGKTLKIYSLGQIGFKNTRKSSNIAHSLLIKKICDYIKKEKLNHLMIEFNGLKRFKHTIIQEIKKYKFKVYKITDITPIPHNGCRKLKKKRR